MNINDELGPLKISCWCCSSLAMGGGGGGRGGRGGGGWVSFNGTMVLWLWG